VGEASDETTRIGWSFPTGFATAPAARRRAFGACGLVFGFPSVSGRFCPSRVTTLATCRFRVLEFPRRVARDPERRGPEKSPRTARVVSARGGSDS
jgi:hypothetical protein